MIYIVHNHEIIGSYEEGVVSIGEIIEKVGKKWSVIFIGEPDDETRFLKCAWTGNEHGHGTDAHAACGRCGSCGCDNCGNRRRQDNLSVSGGAYRAETSESHGTDSSEWAPSNPLVRLRDASRRIPRLTRT